MLARMKWVFLLLMTVLASRPVAAQDYLNPPLGEYGANANPLDEYELLIRRVLAEGFRDDIIANAVITPSFQPVTVVGLRKRGATYEIISLTPRKDIWGYELARMMREGQIRTIGSGGEDLDQSKDIAELEGRLPAEPTDVRVDRCTVGISMKTAGNIMHAWRVMLHDVRPRREDDDIILDGIGYEFTLLEEGHALRGETQSPYKDGRAGRFVDLAWAMRRYCQTEDDLDLAALLSAADIPKEAD